MPINREHAFGGGVVYHCPKQRIHVWIQTLLRNPLLGVKLIISHYTSPAQFRVARAWRQLARHATVSESCRIGPSAWCATYSGLQRPQDIIIEDHAVLRGVLRTEVGGRIRIAPHVYIGDDCILSSASLIDIGRFSMLAHGVHIFDNDSHPLDWEDRYEQSIAYRSGNAPSAPKVNSAPVTIGEHVWIGFNAFISKGVTIGDRCIVAACSVVTKDVPPDTVVAGNPARIVKKLKA